MTSDEKCSLVEWNKTFMNFKLLLLELGLNSISQEVSILCDCFRLDPVLKKACQNDVPTICQAPNLDDQDSYPSSLIMSCLYRHVVLETQTKVRTVFTAFLSNCQIARIKLQLVTRIKAAA